MAPDENELAEAQALNARLLENRRELGIPERASPKQEQSQSAEPDPLANLNEPAKRFIDEFSDAERERLRNNLAQDKPEGAERVGSIALGLAKEITATARAPASGSEEITTGRDAATRSPARQREPGTKMQQPGKSWGKLYASLVASNEFQELGQPELLVCLVLITSRDDKTGESAPGREKIASLLGCNIRTVDRHLSTLAGLGIIRQTKKAHRGQSAAFRVAQDGDDIARNLRERATLNTVAHSGIESVTPIIVAQ